MLDNIQIILVNTTHPGNIGAAARAMKTMGISHLRLIQPKIFPCADATVRAAGADDILANAQLFDSFEESLKDCHLILGTSARERSLAWPTLSAKACAEKAFTFQGKVAIVFGRESAGLTNKELERCHYLIRIPTESTFSSLNVAAAVQILAYELQCASLTSSLDKEDVKEIGGEEITAPIHASSEKGEFVKLPNASAEAMAQFYQHLEQTLIEIEFLNPDKPRRLMRRLHRLFNRVQLIDSEVRILRGILTATQKLVTKR